MKLSEHYKEYSRDFSYLDAELNADNAEKMFDIWSSRYSRFLKNASEENKMEMISRSIRSRRELMTSALLWAEAKHTRGTGCISAYYYLRYYSLFHAMWSVLFLNPELDRKIVEITHSKLKNVFCSYYAQYDYCVFDKDLAEFIESVKNYRETYSYNRPNNLMHMPESENKQERVLLTCYQLTNLFTSMLRSKLPFVDISMDNQKTMIKEFSYFNGHRLEDGSYEFDPFEENILIESIRDGMCVTELEWVLGHDWDELGYNSELNEFFDAAAVDRIKKEAISFIYKAIPFV
ncbi:hypothetical protein [Chordicoccus furentiruminis]|uniref:hypothetical protein n=1 Tax=Chordicoccus furentiruminis TaxID=2709410 RepID=UPI0023A8F1DC|nr:hypothetical protein [Chordicoccus furentiruminis]